MRSFFRGEWTIAGWFVYRAAGVISSSYPTATLGARKTSNDLTLGIIAQVCEYVNSIMNNVEQNTNSCNAA